MDDLTRGLLPLIGRRQATDDRATARTNRRSCGQDHSRRLDATVPPKLGCGRCVGSGACGRRRVIAGGHAFVQDLRPRGHYERGSSELVRADDPEDRYGLFRTVTDQLRVLCAAGPAVALIDDLHQANRDVVLLTRFVARSLHRYSLLLVATWRVDRAAAAGTAARLTALPAVRPPSTSARSEPKRWRRTCGYRVVQRLPPPRSPNFSP
jgi:hypothetical protein